jgi:hypothetical protein
VTYVSPTEIRFGHDHWGGGAIESPTVSIDPMAYHQLEVEMGSLQAAHGAETRTALLVLRLDGRLIMAQPRPFHPAAQEDTAFGFNATDATAASSLFSGQLAKVERISYITNSSLPRRYGAVRLQLKFPDNRIGICEPLLVTGKTGAGDAVFVQYIGQRQIRFGYDHWSVGGPLSPPLSIDYGDFHTIEIETGSLYPPMGDRAWGNVPRNGQELLRASITIKLDDQTVLTSRQTAYPASFDETHVGANPIGASSCEAVFSGVIFAQERNGQEIPSIERTGSALAH